MIENYFFDNNGLEQSEKVKREKAVNAVLDILHAAAVTTGAANSLTHIQGKLSDTADAIQAALEK